MYDKFFLVQNENHPFITSYIHIYRQTCVLYHTQKKLYLNTREKFTE